MAPVEGNGNAASRPARLKPCSVITNGAVSGVLPKSSHAFAVNYPGYPSSISRAVDTLGGLDEIAQARSSGSNQLELRFRPEDPYCHPAFGERRSFAGFLLKISKSLSASDNDGKEQLSAEVVAQVNEAYQFEGMVDYQHVVAVHAAEARRKKWRCVFDEENDLEGEADVMMLVPPLFSPKNIPEEIVLNPPPNLFSRKFEKSVVEHRWEMDIEPCLAIPFNIDKVPERVNWEDKIPRGTTEWELQLAVSKLFEVRPIWPRRSIHEQLIDDGLHVTTHTLKRYLFRSGYYFAKGPFGRFWIRKGYDPRKDPEARKFQVVDFRVPPELRDVSDANTDAGSKQKWKNICQFQVFPWRKFTGLQFFELDDDFIQDEIQKPTYHSACTIKGWFSKTLFETLRLRVKIRFLSICPTERVKVLLQSVSEQFDKCKKALSRIRRAAAGHQQPSQDSDLLNTAGCVKSNSPKHHLLGEDGPDNCQIENEEDGEEEEVGDEEECEEEDEVDTHEYPIEGIEDAFFSSETGSILEDKVGASDYMKDVLRSEFLFCKDGKDSRSGKEIRQDDSSDGEYQIYEQDSDDFDDDDEDDFS